MDGPQRTANRLGSIVLTIGLVLGSFGIGASEFLVMGLLPQIATDLAPDLFASDPEFGIAVTGGMVSGYALGVAVGMIVSPLLLRRLSERHSLIVCAASMLCLTLFTSISPNLAVGIALRFISALTHAAYVGSAALVVSRLLGSNHHGRGAAVVVGGLTGATFLGVPVLTALGSSGDWRISLTICAALFIGPIAVLLLVSPPAHASSATATVDSVKRSRIVVALLAAVTLINCGGFAIVTFTAPIGAWLQGPHPLISVPLLMLLFGVGMNIGNFAGGWIADRSANLAMSLAGFSGLVSSVLISFPSAIGVSAALGVLFTGLALGLVTPAAQVLYLRTLGHRPRLAATLASGTANLGSFLGAIVGGTALSIGGPGAMGMLVALIFSVGLLLHAYRCFRQRSHKT
ncbi:MAG: MFS transporter [Gulosibacter sp.]|uniref:MFS transporter n=1 Tax=Gulosibacter sp. TaxID=2817531 RepID=UPI003F93B7B5